MAKTPKQRPKTDKPKPVKRKGGRPETLTKEIASKLAKIWQMTTENFTDEMVCECCDVTMGQLKGWLQRNIETEIVLNGETVKMGLRSIRERCRSSLRLNYLGRLHKVLQAAEATGDLREARNILCWLMERQFPNEFGNRQKIDMNSKVETKVEMSISKKEVDAAYKKILEIEKEYLRPESNNDKPTKPKSKRVSSVKKKA
jgi:hypothetical protein